MDKVDDNDVLMNLNQGKEMCNWQYYKFKRFKKKNTKSANLQYAVQV